MKQFFTKMLYALFILLYGGGIICGLAFAISEKSVAAILSIIVLGAMALPTAKKILAEMTSL